MNPAQVYESTRAAKRILVVDLGFLGDTVHLVPALWEVKRAYPAASLHVLTSTLGGEVLQLAPCVDRAWTVEINPKRRTLRQQFSVIRELRRYVFDLAINFSGADRGVFLTALSGARLKVAHASGRKHFWRGWLIPAWVPEREKTLPVYEQKREVLRACGLPIQSATWDLRISAEASAYAEGLGLAGMQRTGSYPFAVHFSINASSPLKEWPLGRWIELARDLLTGYPGVRVLATSSPSAEEREKLRAFASGVASERVVVASGLSVPRLAALLGRCQLHIGADSGVLHLAVALGVPTISMFRQYEDATAWMPSGPAHTVVAVPCACVNQNDGPCHPFGPAECLAGIPAEKISALARRRLDSTLALSNASRQHDSKQTPGLATIPSHPLPHA